MKAKEDAKTHTTTNESSLYDCRSDNYWGWPPSCSLVSTTALLFSHGWLNVFQNAPKEQYLGTSVLSLLIYSLGIMPR